MQVLGHSDSPLTGHSDLSMSKQPHSFRPPHPKLGIDDHPTHILHPTLGIAYALLYQEGQVPTTASPAITRCSFVPIPAILFLLTFFFISELNILNSSAFTPEHQSLDAEPQHAMTTHDPTETI